MEKRMNRDELIKLIDSIEIDNDEFWILSSSALVIRNLFPDAGDLDIAVTSKGLEQLKRKYNLKEDKNGWYKVDERIECIVDKKEEWKIEKYDKYNLESLQKYLEYLKTSTREKDKIKFDIVSNSIKHTKDSTEMEK